MSGRYQSVFAARGFVALCAGALASAFVSTAAADEKFDEAAKRLSEAFSKMRSYTGAYVTNVTTIVEGGTHVSIGSGRVEFLKQGGKTYCRMEDEKNTTSTMDNGVEESTQQALFVTDGEFTYRLTNIHGNIDATKMRYVGPSVFNTPEQLESLRKDNVNELLADAQVRGEDTIVIESLPRMLQPGDRITRRRYYFAKNSGMLLKREGISREGDIIETMEITDLKPNAEVSASRFEFQTPPGVKLVDATQPPTPTSGPTELGGRAGSISISSAPAQPTPSAPPASPK